jgi:hypothetical protein
MPLAVQELDSYASLLWQVLKLCGMELITPHECVIIWKVLPIVTPDEFIDHQ